MGRSPEILEVAVEFGARVRARRHELGWSIERLSAESGLHWTYVGSVERGERNVGLRNICRLAAATGLGAGPLMRDLERLV